ncbi:MAG: hypothetical protein IPM61_01885 [Chlorobi bacterium]|nr:MAG: hypothetical protein UZ07_CHB004002205 [Chlorobi bacterium OLB7]MBK8910055.1 hypothetical protein [Chlorobiota bacterium]MBX7217505.1 hypothetical protein [Candidatus Kapabacteria bacterium]
MTLRSLLAHGAILTAFAATTATAQLPGPAANSDVYGHVGIGVIAPDRSALLDLTGTDVGLLIPRLTTAQRNGIALPAKSLLIFNTDANEFQYNWGTPAVPNWQPLLDGANAGNTAWILTGNNGPFTDGTNNLLGTNAGAGDRQVNIIANGQRTIRLVPNATSPTILGGFSGNTASGVGITIAGGGQTGNVNSVSNNFGTIGGGYGNTVNSFGFNGTIAGGELNTVTQLSATVGGGSQNTASGPGSTVAGGSQNSASQTQATVGGGRENTASGSRSTVAGGFQNSASGDYNAVGGGQNNLASGGENNTVAGGTSNLIIPNDGGTISASFIGGGDDNRINSFPNSDVSTAAVGGGSANLIASMNGFPSSNVTIGGGGNNFIFNSNNATIAGGQDNSITSEDDGTNYYSGNTIGGGTDNEIRPGDGGFLEANVIAGGRSNEVIANGGLLNNSTIAGGAENEIRSGVASRTANTVGGGFSNSIETSDYATISGGNNNSISSGNGSAIVGGQNNEVSGDNSMAFGTGANVTQDNSVVFNHTSGTPTRVGVAANNPQVAMDLNGGLAVRPPAVLNFPAGATPKMLNITVGDRSYFRIASDGGSCSGLGCAVCGGTVLRSVTLTNGQQVGQMLIIECTSNEFRIADGGNINTLACFNATTNDIITFIWNGTAWLEVARSVN